MLKWPICMILIALLSATGACLPSNSASEPNEGLITQGSYNSGWISVSSYGHGPDIVLIPGLASSADVWSGTVAQLKSGYRIHVVQVAGFAGVPASKKHRAEIMKGLADDVSDYIAAQKLDRPVIIGHSLGGLIVLRLAIDHPNRISKGVIVDALPFYTVLRNPNATSANSAKSADGMGQQLRDMSFTDYDALQSQSVTTLTKSRAAQQRLLSWSKKSDRETVISTIKVILTTDFRSELAKVTIPMSIIIASDPMMVRSSKAMEALYRTQYAGLKTVDFWVISDSLHFVMYDQPVAFQETVASILERQESSRKDVPSDRISGPSNEM